MRLGQAVCFFEFVCSKAWDDLDVLGDKSSERFCPECMKSVYLCKSDDELKMHVKTPHCVALHKSAYSSFNGHSFQCFVDSALISLGQLATQLGQSATGQKQAFDT